MFKTKKTKLWQREVKTAIRKCFLEDSELEIVYNNLCLTRIRGVDSGTEITFYCKDIKACILDFERKLELMLETGLNVIKISVSLQYFDPLT